MCIHFSELKQAPFDTVTFAPVRQLSLIFRRLSDSGLCFTFTAVRFSALLSCLQQLTVAVCSLTEVANSTPVNHPSQYSLSDAPYTRALSNGLSVRGPAPSFPLYSTVAPDEGGNVELSREASLVLSHYPDSPTPGCFAPHI